MIILKNILSFITDPKNTRMILTICIVIISVLFFRQCEQTRVAEGETIRIANNWKASQDTIRNYIDKNGHAAAEIRALTLTLDEVRDSLDYEKNKPPITVIRYQTRIIERIVEVPVYVIDTAIGNFSSAAVIESKSAWGKSWRKIKAVVPYSVNGDSAIFGGAAIDLQQNIYLTASLFRDNKTDEVFVKLTTDYPGTTFNDAQGILVDQSSKEFKDISARNRKTVGVGLQLGVGLTGVGVSPYVGIGINYTPKFLQW